MFFLRKLFNRSTSPRPRPTPRARPTCEPLEDRLPLDASVNNHVLTVTGTNSDDVIRFVQFTGNRFRVLLNDVAQGGTFKTTGTNFINKVVVLGQNGADKINATKSPVPVVLQGGAGNDKLFDSSFSDLLIGGPDADVLRNRSARDVLIGSEGADNLASTSAAGAILFGGTTSFTNDQLNNVRKQWNSSFGYRTRINRIFNSGGLNWGANVANDGAPNQLIGSEPGGADWFLRCVPNDPAIQHRRPGEVVTQIP